VALVRLDDAEERRLLDGVFRAGSRSVMFRFPDLAEAGGGDMLGESSSRSPPTPEGLLRVELWFWDDIARIYVTPGARFEVWYVRWASPPIVETSPRR
jgi:hypothetical protein